MLSVLAQDPASGIITYGDTTIRHKDKSDVATEFVDFYKAGGEDNLKYLVLTVSLPHIRIWPGLAKTSSS